MLIANLSLLINGLFLIGYIAFARTSELVANQFVLWPWGLFLAYLALQY
jgi:hypothetical protein